MRVNVLFFASLAEEVGCRALELTLTTGSLVGLRSALSERLNAEQLSALEDDQIRMARNQELWDGEGALADGDELAFLPPVTGG